MRVATDLRYVGVRDAAGLLNVGESTIRRAIRRGELKPVVELDEKRRPTYHLKLRDLFKWRSGEGGVPEWEFNLAIEIMHQASEGFLRVWRRAGLVDRHTTAADLACKYLRRTPAQRRELLTMYARRTGET